MIYRLEPNKIDFIKIKEKLLLDEKNKIFKEYDIRNISEVLTTKARSSL